MSLHYATKLTSAYRIETADAKLSSGIQLHDTQWRVGWRLGGLWDGNMWSSRLFTFDIETGRHIDMSCYLDSIEEGDGYEDEVDT